MKTNAVKNTVVGVLVSTLMLGYTAVGLGALKPAAAETSAEATEMSEQTPFNSRMRNRGGRPGQNGFGGGMGFGSQSNSQNGFQGGIQNSSQSGFQGGPQSSSQDDYQTGFGILGGFGPMSDMSGSELPEDMDGERPELPEDMDGERPELPEDMDGERPELPEDMDGERPELPEDMDGERPELPEDMDGERPELPEDMDGERPELPEDMNDASSLDEETEKDLFQKFLKWLESEKSSNS